MPNQQSQNPPRQTEDQTKALQETRAALLNMLEDTEEARRQSEEGKKRTELIIRNLSDGLLVFSPGLALELMNPYAEHLLSADARDVQGKSLEELKKTTATKKVAQLLEKEGNEIFRKELNVGAGYVVEVTSSPFQPGRGEPGTMVVLHDITREREIERMKTEFVSLAAHQLRTPLAGIKWSLRMLLDGDAGKVKEEQADMMGKSLEATERMILLINDLLNVTRIEEGRYLYQPGYLQLSDMLGDMVKSYQDTAKQKKIRLELKLPLKKVPRVLVDAEKIRLAAQNLLENALHYTPRAGTVTVSLRHGTKEVEVSVADTGIGVPKQQQARVFEKFFRATNARKVDTEGSGLGLYLVRNIVEAHGGTIGFQSTEGKGSVFTFSLPLRKDIAEFLKKN